MAATTTAAPIVIPKPHDSTAARVLRFIAKAPVNLVLMAIGVLWLVPTIGLFITSILPASALASKGWWQIFAHPSLATWSNYHALFQNSGLVTALKVTAYIAVGNTLLVVVIGAMAGYAFAWLDFPGRDWLFIGVIGLLVVPIQMALIPMFRLYDSVGLFDTWYGIALFHTAFGLPFAIFLLRNFFVGLPKDILESARIDGAHLRDSALDERRVPARAGAHVGRMREEELDARPVGARERAEHRAPRELVQREPGKRRRREVAVRLGAHVRLPDRCRANAPHRRRIGVRAEDGDLLRRHPGVPQRRVGGERGEPAPDDRDRQRLT
jgi:ABC-type sugar transport system permease subunit